MADTLVRQLRGSIKLPVVLWTSLLTLGAGFILMGATSDRESDATALSAIGVIALVGSVLGTWRSVRKYRGAPTHPVVQAWRGDISNITRTRAINVRTNGYLQLFLEMEHRAGSRAQLECTKQERLEILSWFEAEGIAASG
ncbi:MAG: hypothetical protein AAF938_19595 [Myxococcota bacterium]